MYLHTLEGALIITIIENMLQKFYIQHSGGVFISTDKGFIRAFLHLFEYDANGKL